MNISPHEFSGNILEWYHCNKRALPWRETTDPYKIWLSEIILQQTRVKQGLPYYYSFVQAYPTVAALAEADEKDVLRLWQGLGYYSRARNLHVCAKKVADEMEGIFPNSYQMLLKLPGVGPYTAAAIASFAFNEKVPVLDGNVFRVLARIFGIGEDILSGKGRKVFEILASKLLSKEDPGQYNQAIMEFGALHCTPSAPNCETCIFSEGCMAYLHKLQHALPVKAPKAKVKKRFFYYFILMHEGKLALKERKTKDIWQGLYDFYLVEDVCAKEFLGLKDELLQVLHEHQVVLVHASAGYKHLLTHQAITAKFFHLAIKDRGLMAKLIERHEFKLYNVEEIKALPKPILIANYLKEIFF